MASTLERMQLSLMNLYDRRGNLVWGLGYDRIAGEEISLGELSRERLPSNHPLLAGPFADRNIGGICMTPHGPMLLVSNPVLTNDGNRGARHNRLHTKAAHQAPSNQAKRLNG